MIPQLWFISMTATLRDFVKGQIHPHELTSDRTYFFFGCSMEHVLPEDANYAPYELAWFNQIKPKHPDDLIVEHLINKAHVDGKIWAKWCYFRSAVKLAVNNHRIAFRYIVYNNRDVDSYYLLKKLLLEQGHFVYLDGWSENYPQLIESPLPKVGARVWDIRTLRAGTITEMEYIPEGPVPVDPEIVVTWDTLPGMEPHESYVNSHRIRRMLSEVALQPLSLS